MSRLLGILSLILIVVQLAPAQDEPIPPKRSRMVKMGLFGGFTPGWLFVDVKPINTFLTAGHGAALSEGGMWMTGGAGAAYIMVLPNVRVGGMGMSGGLKSTALANGIRRDANMTVGLGGVTVEYVLPVVERFDVAFGGLLGWGGLNLTLRQNNGGPNTWVGEQELFSAWTSGTPSNMTRNLAGSFFLWAPTVNMEYAILSWLAVRLGATYVGMSFPSWQVDGEYELLGVPSDVSGKGFMIQAGLFVGTF